MVWNTSCMILLHMWIAELIQIYVIVIELLTFNRAWKVDHTNKPLCWPILHFSEIVEEKCTPQVYLFWESIYDIPINLLSEQDLH